MPKNKRLHYKDIDAIRAIVFIPIYLFSILLLMDTTQTGILTKITESISNIAQGSFDFYFFISAFLITSQGIREYKYFDKFSLKKFFIRRTFRVGIVLLFALIFAFAVHPWLIKVLDLQPIITPSISPYLAFVPNYFSEFSGDQLIYFTIICTVYMFIQFYVVWGIILRFFHKFLIPIAIGLVVLGIASRLVHSFNDSAYLLDTTAYGVPMGIGALFAIAIRKEFSIINTIKSLSKNSIIFIYCIGVFFYLSGYFLTKNTIPSVFTPLIISLFFGFMVVEQTLSENSFMQLKTRNILSQLGRINYGMIVYHSIICVLLLIGIESVGSISNYLSSFYVVGTVIIAGYVLTIVTANISYKLFEKSFIRLRRGFKKV